MKYYAADVDLDNTWRARAACQGTDPALWYPEKGDSATADQARQICHTCPVAAQCLAYALATGEKHGIWGGLTEQERRRLRRDPRKLRRRPRCRVPGCDRDVRCRGLCPRHYMRWWRQTRRAAIAA